MAGSASDILRRKAGLGRPPPEIVAMSPEKAMRLAFGRAGRDVPGLGLRLISFATERLVVPALAAAAGPRTLVASLVRAEGGLGVALFDAGFVTALIEAETMGRLRAGDLPDRAPTRIDALIAGGFLDRCLDLYDEVASGLSIAAATTGFRFGAVVSQPATLALMLEDVPFRGLRLGFDFADGMRQGSLLLAMPFDPPSEARAAPGEGFGSDLQQVVLAAPAEVRAVLARLPLPLDTVTAWQPGMLVPLSREVLDRVVLEDIDGDPVGRGRLGQVNGFRAVRLRGQD
jgi:flagellar motor switch protein FliM